VCSKCEPDGLRGPAIKEELLEIHDLALPWAMQGMFVYEVEWDAQSGIHWVTVIPSGEGDVACYFVCEFQAFVQGLEMASKYRKKEAL
jgi:hypothetical protein